MTRSNPAIRIEPLKGHDRAAFTCGVEPLDRYLKTQATQDARRNVAIVFVAVSGDPVRIAGYYTLSAATLRGDDLPADLLKRLRLPKYSGLPATLIGRLAVDVSWQGKGLGELLLFDACRRACLAGRQVASLGVLVDAKGEAARRFYLRYGFIACGENPDRLFLPMQTIAQAFEREA